jgi:hypothetical protein
VELTHTPSQFGGTRLTGPELHQKMNYRWTRVEPDTPVVLAAVELARIDIRIAQPDPESNPCDSQIQIAGVRSRFEAWLNRWENDKLSKFI